MKFSKLILESSYFVNKDKIKTLLGDKYFKDLKTEIRGVLFENAGIKDSNNKYLWLLLNIYANEQELDSKRKFKNYPTSFDHIINTPEDIINYLKDFELKGIKLDLKGIKSFEELRTLLKSNFKVTKNDYKKKGLGSFKENKDYIKIPNVPIEAIIPLNYKVSRFLGSLYFGSCEGKWCTSGNAPIQWIKHIKQNKEILVICLFKDKTKIALQFDSNGNFLEVFNQIDDPTRKDNLHLNIKGLDKIKYYIKKNLKRIKDLLLLEEI